MSCDADNAFHKKRLTPPPLPRQVKAESHIEILQFILNRYIAKGWKPNLLPKTGGLR
jgi:hypothetical protein